MFSKRLMSMVASARRFIALDVVFQWIALLANIALFIMIGSLLQSLLEGTVESTSLIFTATLAIGVLIVRFVCQSAAKRMGQRSSEAAKITIRQAIYTKLVSLGPSYRETIPTSEALQISVEGVEHLETYFGAYIPQLFYAVLAPLTLFVCLAPLSLPTAIVLLVCVPFIPLSIVAVQKIAKRVMGRYWDSYTDLGSVFLESIQGLSTLKVFQADEARHKTMNQEAETFRQATMRLLTMQLNSITVMDLFAFGGAAVGIIMALAQLASGNASFGAVFAIIFLSAEFFLPMRTLGSFFHTAMSGMSAAERMFALLDTPNPPTGSRIIDPNHTDIACSEVTYSYDGQRMVLNKVSLDIPQGSFVGITGESGSGKSTLAAILSGSIQQYNGTVCIGGIDIREVSRTSLRETITYVPFASYLFEGSVRSNLCLAKPQATDEELWSALRQCRLDAFVQSAGGLNARVAPEGSNLSGGQRQRLAMARALLHDTPIYVLDEATSNIDAESEAVIMELAQELAAKKTIIMITHRLSALKNAANIYVLEEGHLAEAGTHANLTAQEGTYGRLWAQQAKLEVFASNSTAASAGIPAATPGTLQNAAAFGSDERPPGEESPSNVPPDTTEASNKSAQASAHKRSHLSVMLKLVGLTKPLLPVMVLAIALGVLGFGAAIFLTVFAVYGLLDIAGDPAGMAWTSAAIAVAVCGIIRGPLRYGEQLCNHYLAFRILALVRDKLFAIMRKLAPAKLEGRNKGNLLSVMTSDVELLEVFYAHTLSPALIALIVSLGMVVFIAFQSPLLALYSALAYLIVGVVVPQISSKASGTSGREMRDGLGSLNTFILDSLRGLPEILQFGRENTRIKQMNEKTAHLARTEDGLKKRTALFSALTGTLVLALDLGMLALAGWLVGTGQIGFAPALLALAALMSSFGPVVAIANLGTNLQQTLAAGARVLDILEEEPVVEEVFDGADLDAFEGAGLHHVDFSYGQNPVLSGVEVSITPGTILRISGKSGAGKSTLLKLLMRFWDPENGVVDISGHDVRHINTPSLRSAEDFMAQETFLFSGSIKENLLIARPDATDAELEEALEKASLGDLVRHLPQGIDTPLGDLGDSLSGGERQRMGLARMFLHDAPFILLDEPTSNLDSLNEAAVLKSLSEHRAGKTVIIVSHRPSAAAIADAVYSVESPDRAS